MKIYNEYKMTDAKISEIRNRVRAGVPEGEIKEELIRSGYNNADIAKVFAPHQYDMRSWYLGFAIILFFVGIWLFLDRKGLLALILSGLLFLQYYLETDRLKKSKISN